VFVALELKVDSKVDPLQKWNLDMINKAGGLALEVNPGNWEDIYRVLSTLAEKGDFNGITEGDVWTN